MPADVLGRLMANPQVEREQAPGQEASRELQLAYRAEHEKQSASKNEEEDQPADRRQNATPPRMKPFLVALLLKAAGLARRG